MDVPTGAAPVTEKTNLEQEIARSREILSDTPEAAKSENLGETPKQNASTEKSAAETANDKMMDSVCTEVIKAPFLAASVYFDNDEWKLQEIEAEALGPQLNALAKTYLPQLNLESKWGPLISFAICLGITIAPRALTQIKLTAERRKKNLQPAPSLVTDEATVEGVTASNVDTTPVAPPPTDDAYNRIFSRTNTRRAVI